MISEVVADLRKRKPGVIIVTSETPAPPKLAELIGEDYSFVGQVNYAKLYERH